MTDGNPNPGNTGENVTIGESDRARRRITIPSRLLGGRLRTTTVAMCVAWFALWMLYLYFNQDDEQTAAPQGAVVISETPYVPYVPDPEPSRATTTTPEPTTTTPTTTNAPSTEPTTTAPSGTVTTTPPTTTDTPLFRLPQIPGVPGLDGGTGEETTEQTGGPDQ